MAKFMSAELIRLRDNLTCGHCKAVFSGSDSQAWKVKYESLTVYCSDTCRHASLRAKFSTPIPNRGPCKHCGNNFFSRSPKIYCSLDCYTKSIQFRSMIEKNKKNKKESVKPGRRGKDVKCLECEEFFYQKPATQKRRAKKYCSTTCYRSHLAKRFDRWVANPEGLALPQCYDEFFDKEELSCFVDGCDWHGQWLSLHMNLAHGVNSDEFKRAAGFNLGTGVIAKPLAKILRGRPTAGNALKASIQTARIALDGYKKSGIKYVSLESKEHRKKSRLILSAEIGTEQKCIFCGNAFNQKTIFGRALYCSVNCRDMHYSIKRKSKPKKIMSRKSDGTFVWNTPND